MFFRAYYILRKFDLGDQSNIELNVPLEDGTLVNIQFSLIPKDQLKGGQKEGDILCIATVEKKFTPRQAAKFEALTDEIPEGIRQTISPIIDELRSAVKRGVRVFMWKRGLLQVHNFIRPGVSNLEYSIDGISWKIILGNKNFSLVSDGPIPKSSEVEECNRLLSESYSQPLGHELLSEAWSLKDYSFRSSLVIGIAAAETGFKECVNKLMPDASWLILNFQSPPLEKMITGYLPTFHAKLLLNGKVIPPPESVIKSLVDGIGIRNKVSHGKASEITSGKLTEVLKAVRDLLYLLDFYCGHRWALDRVRSETIQEMTAVPEKK